MIVQARITSDTTATVHLAEETVEVAGADLPEIRDRVKQIFISSATAAEADLDVVIVEPDVRHHLRVEPSGRITGREEDGRPVHGPALEDPLLAPPSDDTVDLGGIDQRVLGSPATGELPSVRPHGARRRRVAAMPASGAGARTTASAASATSAGSATSATSPGSETSAPSPGSETSALSPGSATSATSAPSAPTAGSAASADSAPSPGSAPSASPVPSLSPAAATTPDSPASPARSSAASPSAVAPAAATPRSSAAADPASGAEETARRRPLPARTAPERSAEQRERDAARPTLQDLQSSTAKREKVRATLGLPGLVTRLTGGVISPRPNARERRETERLQRIRRPLDGPRNIAVVNLKGGAHKTTSSLMIAATLGVTRGGNVLAWDNNETRGTLGWRGVPTDHHRTAVDLLHDIDRLRSPEASNADLDPYVRPQGEMRFDILASDEDPGSAASIDADAFADLDEALSRFYRIKVIDTGNNVRASNWLASVRSADQLVIVSTVREDTFNAAAWMIDELRATGLAEQVDHAVTILSHSSKGKFDATLRSRLLAHFGAHTRAVTEVPYEKQFVDGSHLDWHRVSPATKEAWLDATALIIDGL